MASGDVRDEQAMQTGEDSESSRCPTNSCQGNVTRHLRQVVAGELGGSRCPTPARLVNFFTREKKTEQSARQAAGHVVLPRSSRSWMSRAAGQWRCPRRGSNADGRRHRGQQASNEQLSGKCDETSRPGRVWRVRWEEGWSSHRRGVNELYNSIATASG